MREDPQTKGLLYAGTENGPFVSFNDGGQWATLQMNMPTVSVRDMVVHGDDLVAGTYGRAFWILDDLTPLRQINAKVAHSKVHLFRPAIAIRLRNDMNQDTPLPPEMPAGDNPPTGAVLAYYLQSAPAGDVSLKIYDQNGRLVRELSSKPQTPRAEPPPPVPSYWLYHPPPLPKNFGMNRYVWDLRYPSPDAVQHEYAISALYQRTPAEPQGPLVVPGRYEVRLTVEGKTYAQPLTVAMDPRVKVTQAELQKQFELAQTIGILLATSYQFHENAQKLQTEVAERESALEKNEQSKVALQAVKNFDSKLMKVRGEPQRGFGGGGTPKPTFTLVNSELGSLSQTVNQADMAPTAAMRTAYRDYCHDMTNLAQQWTELMKELPAVNAQLTAQAGQPLSAVVPNPSVPECGQ